MKIIKLTTEDNVVYMNLDEFTIRAFSKKGSMTRICFTHNETMYVKETPEEILKLINE